MDDTGDALDRALVERIAGGDREAFEALYHRHARRIAAFVRTVCAVDDIDDVVSETLVGAWRGAARYRGRSRVTTWLFAIAHHHAIDRVRRRRHNVVALDAARDIAAVDGDPVDAALRNARVRELDAALATLSPQHSAVLDLFYAHDRTIAEIAAIVGAPVPTVKTRLFYAKRNLQSALARGSSEATA
jgi:RNA polymerase sigma-70 factor (ECF subfamily)